MPAPANPGTTNPLLLARLWDWADHPAWGEFFARYAPLVRSRCRRFGVGDDVLDDVCQWIWIGLSERLRAFRYDPEGSFRGWLRRYCDSRLIDRARVVAPARDLPMDAVFGREGPPARAQIPANAPAAEDVDEPAAGRPRLLGLAAEVHRRVREQVSAETWRAFWLVAVEDRGVREAADALGKSYAATFAAQKRVRRMLRDEGVKLLGAAGAADAEGACGGSGEPAT